MSKVWLITGSGNGLGRNVVETALKAGHRVMATARDTAELDELMSRYGAQMATFVLDVRDEAVAQAAVQATIDRFGRVDVLVNNAGYGDTRPFEQVPSEEFRALVDTCLFGAIYLTRAVLPHMRQQRSGHIIQISSAGGRTAFPGNAAYFAAKWGLGGFTEGVAQEVAHLGIVMTCLEPGGMRTNWGKKAHGQVPTLLPDYEASVGAAIKSMEGIWGNENGDPDKVAEVIMKVAEARALPPHILLGSDTLQMVNQAEAARHDVAEQWAAISRSIDMDAASVVPELPVS